MAFRIACLTVTLCAAGTLASSSYAYATCRLEGVPFSTAKIDAFLQKPEIILGDDSNSKRSARELRLSVSQYAVAGPAAIQAIRSILPRTTVQQRTAIGEGLYAAVNACWATDPAMAARIDSAIKSISDRHIIAAYRLGANLSSSSGSDSSTAHVKASEEAKAASRGPKLIEEPTPNSPGSLKLSDPFGKPDAWR